MTYLNILFIAVIFVCISDLTDVTEHIGRAMARLITKGKVDKPIDFKLIYCSLCQTHWTGLLYLLITGTLTIHNYMVLLLISVSTPLIKNALNLVLDTINYFIIKINRKLQ